MQKDRKPKLDEAFIARRRRQLACCLASTLGVVVSTSLCTMSTMAFDLPPASQQKSVYMEPIGVGQVSSHDVDNGQVSNSDALKRVGIRFVAPESTARHNKPAAEPRTAGSSLPQPREALQPPFVIQPPMVISSVGTIPNQSGANDSSIAGIRIRIPADKPINNNATSSVAIEASSSGSSLTVAGPTKLKMTVGTGVALQPTGTTNTSAARSNVAFPAPSTIETPTLSASIVSTPQATLAISATQPVKQAFEMPSMAAPPQITQQLTQPKLLAPSTNLPADMSTAKSQTSVAAPSPVESKSNESVAAQVTSGSKLQAKLQDNSKMTSRAPGIVRIPSMVVSGIQQSTFQLPQTMQQSALPITSSKADSNASVATTTFGSELAFVAPESTIKLPPIESAQTQVIHSRTPSLASIVPKRSSPQDDISNMPVPTFMASNTGFQALPSTLAHPANLPRTGAAVNAESFAQTANRSMELADRKIASSGPYSSGSKLMDATARSAARYEPSIIPVALVSTASKEETASNVSDRHDDLLESSTQLNIESTPVPTTSAVNVALKTVQSIRLPGKVSRVLIEDDTVCRVISTEPNTLTIIGASIGDSKITVWSTNSITKADETQIFKISVRETWGQAAKNTVSIDDVNQSIAALFPGSTIVIKPNSDGSISVQGNATSNESAKQILMLVRKMFLVPVQDRIAIANL